jgi:hypothetical protein
MYYIGWKPNGDIFDSSIDDEKLKSPLPGGGSYIAGWSEGVIGMKVGGVRVVTIPADKAYGEGGGQNDQGQPLGPLKFVIMAIPTPDIPYPKGTVNACIKAFTSQYGDLTKGICEESFSNEEK